MLLFLLFNYVNRKIQEAKICKFTWFNKSGEFDRLRGRYDGAIGALSEMSSADVFTRWEILNENWKFQFERDLKSV